MTNRFIHAISKVRLGQEKYTCPFSMASLIHAEGQVETLNIATAAHILTRGPLVLYRSPEC